MPVDKPTYEAFFPHHTTSKHRVMTVTGFPGHTQLHALATLPDALTARRLADALNSTLLNRRNHDQRLDQALVGLPDSVQAAVRQLAINPEHANVGRPALATHIYNTPIDGVMLFPTTSCTPGACPDCDGCANDCRDCPVCDSTSPCENCLPPDLTPRTADALVTASYLHADNCYDVVHRETSSDRATRDSSYLMLPKAMHRQDTTFIRNMARVFDDLAGDLLDGIEPSPRNMAEQVALDLVIQLATDLHTDKELCRDVDLPVSFYDFDFDGVWELLFEDDDHIGYLGNHEPDAPGTLDHLFEPFWDDNDRDPNRGFRR